MGNSISAAIPAIGAAISAVELVNWLEQQPATSTTAAAHQAPELHSGIRGLLLFASAAGFTASVTFTYGHLHRGAGNSRLPEIVLYVCAGVFQLLLFVQQAPGDTDDVVDHRALGLAAIRVLPAAATVTFFLGALLIVAGHIRAGGEGGGGAVVAVAGEEPIQAPPPVGLLRLLSRMALAAAAGTVCLMAFAVYGSYY